MSQTGGGQEASAVEVLVVASQVHTLPTVIPP